MVINMIDNQLFGKKRLYKIGQEIASGGEGKIFSILNDNGSVIKLYNQTSKELEMKIKYMADNPPSSEVLYDIAWPTDVLYDENDNFVGFVMPKLIVDSELKNLYQYNPSTKASLSYENKIIVGINLCKVISEVHKAGYIFGDFNPQNIGVNLITGHVGFFDADSYHVYDGKNDIWYKCGVGFDGYIAPELIEKAKGKTYLTCPMPTFTKETDNFALAIHIFKLLFNGFTPFNGITEESNASTASPGLGNQAIERDNYCFKQGYKPLSNGTPNISSFPDYLVELFNRAFIDGRINPYSRPTAEEWCDALIRYRSECVKCENDSSHFFYFNKKDNKIVCPYCEANYRALLAQGYTNIVRPINVPLTEEEKEKKKNIIKEKIETILQYIAIFLPILTAIIFAIILFSNKEQIEIKSSFGGWCTGWVFYLIASIISTIVIFNIRKDSYSNDMFSRLSATIIFVVVSIFTIIVICNSSNLSSDFYPPNDIKIEFTSLEHTSSYSNYNETKVYLTL